MPQSINHHSTRLLLVRHAEVEENYQGVFGGRIDMELSPRGHLQAEVLSRYLKHRPLKAIYASPMRRVRQTIAPLAGNGLPAPIIVPELREVDFGDWTGRTWAEIETHFGVTAFSWLDQLESAAIANAESSRTLRARIEPRLQLILSTHANEEVALVCHGGVIRMVLSILLVLPLPQTAIFEVEYGSVSQVVWIGGQPRLEVANLTPWRDRIP